MLEDKNKKNPFSVPENYFQNFNAEILNNLPEKEVNKKKNTPLWKTVSGWVAVAAAITGLAFVGMHYMDNGTSKSGAKIIDANYASDDNAEALDNDYYLFLEEEATKMAYRDAMFND